MIEEDFDDIANMTIRQARELWAKSIEGKGTTCPCCDRMGKINKYSLTKGAAMALRWIAINGDDYGWVDVPSKAPRWVLKSKFHSTLQHWKMLESQQKRSGIWRVTPLGKSFIAGERTMPVAVWVYNKTVMAYDDERTTFRGCFDREFDFDEMMSARFNWASVVIKEKKKK